MSENPVRVAATDLVQAGLQHVTIDHRAVDRTAARMAEVDIALPEWRHPALPDEETVEPETVLDYLLVGNSLNFQFHRRGDRGVYTRRYDGETVRGAFAMWGSLTQALEAGQPVTDGAFLADLDRETVTELFAGDPEIPYLADRHRVLSHVGATLLDVAEGRFHRAVPTDEPIRPFDDGHGLVEWLAREFPQAYGDSRSLSGRRIPFLKKAQLAVALLAGRFANSDRYDVVGLDDLTLFADYVVPAILREYGVLEYDALLAPRIDEYEPIPENSRMEVEIRAATVVAGDRILETLARDYGIETTPVHLDYALWETGRDLDLALHKTATTAY
jgi:hypothetical protein